MRQIRNFASALAVAAAAAAAWTIPVQTAAGAIQTISPAAGRAGDTVTITGQGFGALNVRVTVGGMAADVVSANGNRVTFRVPAGVPAGLTTVAATNPGGHTGTIGFRLLEGVLLSGAPSADARSATTDMPPVAAPAADIVDGLIMTRLDVRFRPGATIAQINGALGRVGGGIVTMTKGQPAVTIAIPRPADVAALVSVADTLNALPGISRAALAHEAAIRRLPGSSSGSDLNNVASLIPSGFPAAWNASALATENCASRTVTVVVADVFDTTSYTGFFNEIPKSNFHFLFPPTGQRNHGDEVTTTMAARFDPNSPTGAVPFPECLDIQAIPVNGLSELQRIMLLAPAFPLGKFVMNYSMGYTDELKCLNAASGCTPADVYAELDLALDRAYDATDWKTYTSNRWDDFFLGVAGGNERNLAGTAFYRGLGVAAFDSMMSVATLPDPTFAFVQDASQWDPQGPGSAALPQLTATDAEKTALEQYIASLGSSASVVAKNTLLVGAADAGTDGESLVLRPYSDLGTDVSAVGENVFTITSRPQLTEGGTSLATPQVTGLAAYLWLLSSGAHARNPAIANLSAQPSSVTRRAILANARAGLGANVIDAYASVLSLDAAAEVGPTTAPVRLALLDVDETRSFDENDLFSFVSVYVDNVTGDEFEPLTPSYSRFDLNGDGYTGGSRTARFDLDRVGSTQFGAARYSQVLQNIGGSVAFDERAVTDMQVLCYYAYSPLYTAHDPDTRDQLLAGRCAPITVTVDPASVTLTPGVTRQFSATVHGTADPGVTWSAGGGTITATGLFTAGAGGGTFKVRATSVRDPDAFGEATVTVNAGAGNFFATENITIRVGAGDIGAPPLVQEFRQADNQSATSPLLPLVLDKSGSQEQPGYGNVTFRMRAEATFPTAGPFRVPAAGTHAANVFCTTVADGFGGPNTGAVASGTLHIPAVAADGRTPADFSLTLGGMISRGPGAGDLEGAVSYTGRVHVDWTSGGVAQPNFTINAANYLTNPGGQVDTAIARTLNVAAPGFVDVTWSIGAGCQAGPDQRETGSAAGSIGLSYQLAR